MVSIPIFPPGITPYLSYALNPTSAATSCVTAIAIAHWADDLGI